MATLLRSTPVAAAIAVGVLATTSPAFAEGSFTSSISGWLPGVETRAWHDANRDNKPTKFAAAGCDYDTTGIDVENITMELNRNDTWTPDEHYGNRTVPCTPRSKLHDVSWGDRGEGNFDMTLKKIDGAAIVYKGRLKVKTVKISY